MFGGAKVGIIQCLSLQQASMEWATRLGLAC